MSQPATKVVPRVTKNDNHEQKAKNVNREVTIEVFGKPQPKGRPRFTKTGRTYTDAKTKAAETNLLSVWLIQQGKTQPHDGAVSVVADFIFEPPTSWAKWKRDAALAGAIAHTTKPDTDNLLKIVDGLNGFAWHDDSQIDDKHGRKSYGSTALTRLTFTFKPATPNRKETK